MPDDPSKVELQAKEHISHHFIFEFPTGWLMVLELELLHDWTFILLASRPTKRMPIVYLTSGKKAVSI